MELNSVLILSEYYPKKNVHLRQASCVHLDSPSTKFPEAGPSESDQQICFDEDAVRGVLVISGDSTSVDGCSNLMAGTRERVSSIV